MFAQRRAKLSSNSPTASKSKSDPINTRDSQKKNDNDSNKDDVEVDSTLTTRKTRQMSDLCKGLASTQLSVDSASNEPVKTSRKRKLSDLCNEIDSSNETEPESANESESINDEIDEKPGNKKRGKGGRGGKRSRGKK